MDPRIQAEIEFARALTALILAARLDEAETRAEEAYRVVIGEEPIRARRRLV